MARRADHTREELAALAMEAGLIRIKNDGFAHFSIRKVATDIGYTVGTLYNVFGSYDDFVLRLNACTLDEWYDIMQTALLQHSHSDQLHVLAEAYVAFSRSHYHQWSALFEHQPAAEFVRPEWYLPKMTRFFVLVEAPLIKLLHDSAKAKRSARTLWAGIHGICVLALSGKLDLVQVDSAESLAISFVDTYVAGLSHAK